MTLAAVESRRHAEREALLARARAFAGGLDPALGVEAVVVIGSVARGDFNLWSDVDVIVVADRLPDRFLDRQDALGERPGRVQPIAWRRDELVRELQRRNPMAVEAIERGVWLVGSPAVAR